MAEMLKMARWEALKLLGMANQRYASHGAEVYEIHCRHWKHGFNVRCPICLKQVLVNLGARFLECVRPGIQWVMDLLFEASAETGEWFAGIFDLDLREVRELRRPRPG